MKLMFTLKFGSSDQWGEVSHSHTVAVSDDFAALVQACIALTKSGNETMERLYPCSKERNSAHYSLKSCQYETSLV